MSERPFSAEDVPALAAFLAADEERLLGRPSRISEADLASWLHRVDLPRHSLLVERDGEIRALAWVDSHGPVGVGVIALGRDVEDGLGDRLVGWSETLLRREPVERIHQIALAADTRLGELLAAHGYRDVRRFWEMTIELDGEPPAPVLPAGMRIEAFDAAAARPFHDALEEAFQDHWEHHSRSFEEWWEEKRTASDFDPTLWFVVHDGAALAATVRNDPSRNGGGWVAALGVRRAWRGRGLGRALLLHSFREFHRRGLTRVSLGVDAENPTGATRLYESVGMHVDLEQVVWEKALVST